jgi:hypothetical protein
MTYLENLFNTLYPIGINDFDAVKKNFLDQYGVDIKQEGNFYILKYDMIGAKWLTEVPRYCRGHVLKWDGRIWSQASHPWNKFWNSHEGHSGVHTEEAFKARLDAGDLRFVQKADGTCIQVWHDGEKWHASTLGMINTGMVQDYDKSFSDLFWSIFQGNADEILGDITNTYLFELCTPYNRIVTKYEKNTIFLLGARSNVDGRYAQLDVLKRVADACGASLPKVHRLADIGVDSLVKAQEWVEAQASDRQYGEFSEGFVMYDGGTPIAKFKNSNYLALHHVGGGDTKHSKNVLIEAFFAGSVDDIEKVLNDHLTGFLANLRAWYADKRSALINEVADIAKGSYETQKDYAMRVMKVSDKRLSSFFFSNKDKVLAGKVESEDIARYFKSAWSKFEDDIKGL